MNTSIVTQSTVESATVKPVKLTKQMERICREDAQRQAHEAQVIADNAEWCKQMGFSPDDAVGLFL